MYFLCVHLTPPSSCLAGTGSKEIKTKPKAGRRNLSGGAHIGATRLLKFATRNSWLTKLEWTNITQMRKCVLSSCAIFGSKRVIDLHTLESGSKETENKTNFLETRRT